MSDKEHEIPVKVVDRRWWANADASRHSSGSAATSLKPTYVEELEQKVAEKDKQIQEYLTKYRQASSEFDEMRLRLRREISKDVERARRESSPSCSRSLDNLERAVDAARTSPSAETLLQGVDMVRRQFLSKLEGLGVKPIESADARFDPALHEAVSTVPAATPEQDGKVDRRRPAGLSDWRRGPQAGRGRGRQVVTRGTRPHLFLFPLHFCRRGGSFL